MRGERQIITAIRQHCSAISADLLRGIGDDCAVVRTGGDDLQLFSVDTLVESVHFDLSWHPPIQLGRKSVAVNVSDIAAMGGTPSYILLSLGLPARLEESWLDAFMSGMRSALAQYNMLLIGGDTVASEQATFSLTVVGTVPSSEVVYRSGARPGDQLLVCGPLGMAAAGLELCRAGRDFGSGELVRQAVNAHLDPQPQVDLGRLLARTGLVSAMMDISDGLATDCAHLCQESGVGAEIFADALPIAARMPELAQDLGIPLMDWVVAGGEDYKLLCAVPKPHCAVLRQTVQRQLGLHMSVIGRIVGGKGVALLEKGRRREISYQGYEHLAVAP